MVRVILTPFVLYQLFNLPNGTSVIANGTAGAALAAIAVVITAIIWFIKYDEATSFQPFSTLLW